MKRRRVPFFAAVLLAVCSMVAGASESDCRARGWVPLALPAGGFERRVLWKAPAGPWRGGAIVVMHGGGGHHWQWCAPDFPLLAPQARFVELALREGYAVFLPDSSAQTTDTAGRACGKVWDDEVRERTNLDLPFLGGLLATIPALRPAASRSEVFLTGLSSGGYMALRAATHFGERVAAFAPVSSGDPYGWHRICEKGMTARRAVHGVALDNETGKRISEPGACSATHYPGEKPWDGADGARKPPFRLFHHLDDGVHDWSCGQKALQLLRRHGYAGPEPYLAQGGGRSFANHLWQDEYSRPLLDFFAAQLR